MDLSETEIVKDSWIIPPEGEEDPEDETDEEKAKREEEAEEVMAKVQELAQAAASKLATKNPNGRVCDLYLLTTDLLWYRITL